MALRIFVSHSHKDAGWCDAFVDHLATYDIDIWYDRTGLYAGAQWVRTIEDELSNRDIFLVILTPDSWASKWVREELALAFAAEKRIVGVVMKQTQLSGFITQRQMLHVEGLTASASAQSVATSLGLQPRQAAPAPPEPQPLDAAAVVGKQSQGTMLVDLSGNWREVIHQSILGKIRGSVFQDAGEQPWVLHIEQSGDTLTGGMGVGEVPRKYSGKYTTGISGYLSSEEVVIKRDDGIYTFHLRIVAARLVGYRESHRGSIKEDTEFTRM